MNSREISGTKRAADREALETHVTALGGKLLEITGEKDVPEKAEAHAPVNVVVAPEAAAPEETLSGTNLLSLKRKGKKPDWLILVFGWLTVVSGGLVSAASIGLLISGFLSGFGWMGTQSTPEEKVFILSILISFGALQLILGVQMLRKPVFGAWLLLSSSFVVLVPAVMKVLSKRYAAGTLDILLAFFIIWHILRKRR